MDESWRMRMGMPPARHVPQCPARRSAEDTISRRRRNTISDFDDVFGGAPRTSLSRQFYTSGFQRSPSSSTAGFSYEEIFQTLAKETPPVARIGRRLPEFRIPGPRNNGVYSEIFWWENHDRVVTPSMANSEELSPLRPAVSVAGYDYASKFRPINVEWRPTTTGMAFEGNKQNMMSPPFALSRPYFDDDNNDNNNDTDDNNFKSYSFSETISLELMSNGSMQVSAEDLDLQSSPSSSLISSVFQSSNQGQKTEDDEEEEMRSYVIEIDSENREGTCESNGVDEAIAWVKEKFQMNSPTTEEISNGYEVSDQGHTDSFGSLDERRDTWESEEETEQFEYTMQTEMQILDAKVNLWLTGKKANIRLLLSSLHQILWPDCGWLAMPATNLTGTWQVKKAYQKARLCLHPDKVQQRGDTIPQKYIAKKVSCVLQDGWEAFVAKEG